MRAVRAHRKFFCDFECSDFTILSKLGPVVIIWIRMAYGCSLWLGTFDEETESELALGVGQPASAP